MMAHIRVWNLLQGKNGNENKDLPRYESLFFVCQFGVKKPEALFYLHQ